MNRLDDLPFDLLVHVFRTLAPSDLSHVALASRHFFFGPPVSNAQGAAASPVAEALRQRAVDRGVAAPAELPCWAPTWSAYFVARERRRPQEEPAIAAGRHHSLLIDGNGQLLRCGASDSPPSPISALAGVRVRSVVADSWHSVAVSCDGHVYSWGSSSHGELGHGDTEHLLQPTLVAGLAGVRVRSVAIGPEHGLAVTEAGAVYSWGSGAHGCLGYSPPHSSVCPPRHIDALEGVRIRCVAAARAASLAVSEEGLLYAWGTAAPPASQAHNCGPHLLPGGAIPSFQPLRGALEGSHIVAISAGGDHFLALSAGGAVFSWGHDEGTGKTGLLLAGGGPRVGPILEPMLVEALHGTRVVGVVAGDHHSCALTSAGELLTWGFGGFGALGHGDTRKQAAPKRVEALRSIRIVSVATSATHTIAVSEEGAVFAWGAQNSPAPPAAAPATGGGAAATASADHEEGIAPALPTLPLLSHRIPGVCAQL
jgi:hypothetical protein